MLILVPLRCPTCHIFFFQAEKERTGCKAEQIHKQPLPQVCPEMLKNVIGMTFHLAYTFLVTLLKSQSENFGSIINWLHQSYRIGILNV